MFSFRSMCVSAALVCAALSLPATAAAQTPDLHSQLDALFNKGGYGPRGVQMEWQADGESYAILEPATNGKGIDIAAYDPATGKRSVLVSAAQLIPQGANAPLQIHGYSWSADRKKMLIFTN